MDSAAAAATTSNNNYNGNHTIVSSVAPHGEECIPSPLLLGDNHHHPVRSLGVNGASVMRPGILRSHPIAIHRHRQREAIHNNNNNDDDSDSSSDEQANDRVRNRLSGDTKSTEGCGAQSLPSRLLRAPLLASCSGPPDLEEECPYSHLLPPPMTLNDPLSSSAAAYRHSPSRSAHSLSRTSYGSLRDSHARGRFLDGPRSFRDRQTGMVQAWPRVRFQTPSPAALSIGERIQHNTRHKQAVVETTDTATSSLSALLEQTSLATTSVVYPNGGGTVQPVYDDVWEDTFAKLPDNVLSTSLTGLEILQRGMQLPNVIDDAVAATSNEDVWKDDVVVRDTQVHNALLSRSFSDPTPLQSRAGNNKSPLLMSYQQYYPPHSAVIAGYPPAVQPPPDEEEPFSLEATNPDTEGAFDMDME
jgi:hypothetical protein